MSDYKYRGEFNKSGEMFFCNDLKQMYECCLLNLTSQYLENMRQSECCHIFSENDEIRPVMSLIRHSDDHSCKIVMYRNFNEYLLREFSFDEEEI